MKKRNWLVQGWTDVAVPRMARSDEHAESPEVMRFSRSMKGTLTQDVSSASSTKDGDRRGEQCNVCEHDSLQWRLSPKALTHIEHYRRRMQGH